ncbi:MAG TPA: C4-type zinc ribbon domain-containing protein [Myxococcota bacterium]
MNEESGALEAPKPVMFEAFQRLAELQACDDELWAIELEHTGLPARRSGLQAERAALEAAAAQSREALQQAEAAQRRIESELQDQEALRKRLESQQFQVKTNDAYTALLHEIESAQRTISECETRLLEGMDAIESSRAALASAEAAGREASVRLDVEGKALDAREQQLDTELVRLRAARLRVIAASDPKLIEQYEKIATRRRPATVRIRGTLCLGCRVDIPPQLCIEIQRAARVVTCGNCQRIVLGIDRA